ncbi:MAG: biotin--[acetyl-CoA-carboxylase] ligase [Bacteroidaceae bacterium]|nr:biotin--[acetyl-CoA-carboxylase] ligase [Bacteroidaceae bacterium]
MALSTGKETVICRLGETGSTNTWIKANCKLPDGCILKVAVAQFQTGGRGQKGNSWESADGRNLLFSILSQPEFIDASHQFCLSEAISCAITDALTEIFPEIAGDISIKWPNDIYWKDRKLAGILIENTLSGHTIAQSIIGTGLNVNQQHFASDAPNPVSLYNITGHVTDTDVILQSILGHFLKYYTEIRDDMSGALHGLYMQRLFRRKGFYEFRDSAGPFKAAIHSVQPNGILILKDTDGKKRGYEFKQVSYIL